MYKLLNGDQKIFYRIESFRGFDIKLFKSYMRRSLIELKDHKIEFED